MFDVEQLRENRYVTPVAYHEFMLHTSKGLNGLFLFFEGKDIHYYLPRITPYYKGDYHQIICKGKQNVTAAYELIHSHKEYDVYKKAFFIDRDFNTPISPDKLIFETPCYSVENFYVSVEVFKKILKGAFQIPETNETFGVLSELYLSRQQEFHQAVLLFNVWYACLIETRERTGKKTGVQLEEKFPKGFIKITPNGVTAHYDLDSIKRLYPNAIDVPEGFLASKLTEFRNCICHLTFRGKYEMEFLLAILKLLIDDASVTQTYLKEKSKFIFSSGLSLEQALNTFSPYAETPDGLPEYLRRVVS